MISKPPAIDWGRSHMDTFVPLGMLRRRAEDEPLEATLQRKRAILELIRQQRALLKARAEILSTEVALLEAQLYAVQHEINPAWTERPAPHSELD